MIVLVEWSNTIHDSLCTIDFVQVDEAPRSNSCEIMIFTIIVWDKLQTDIIRSCKWVRALITSRILQLLNLIPRFTFSKYIFKVHDNTVYIKNTETSSLPLLISQWFDTNKYTALSMYTWHNCYTYTYWRVSLINIPSNWPAKFYYLLTYAQRSSSK
jgi:hypothetical protein